MLRSQVRDAPRRFVRRIQTFEALDSQVNVLRNGKAVMAQGSGGRASRTGYTVTVFGAPGQLGTALVTKLAKQGTITVAPYREEYFKRHLKVTGDHSVVNFQEFDLRNVGSIEDSVRHSDVVVNLIGRDWETKNFSFWDVHVEGTRRIAEAAKEAGIPRLIQVSTHSADVNSSSKFYATKAIGEEVAREIFPDATIVRPAPIFGSQDRFLQAMASRLITLTANGGRQTIYPVYLADVATALETIVYDDSTAGKLYELNGPDMFSVAEVHEQVRDIVKRNLQLIDLPKPLLMLWAHYCQWACYWTVPVTPDVVERMFIDQVVSKNALGFKDLGITPQRLSDWIYHLTQIYRPNYLVRDSYETAIRRDKENKSWSNIVQ